MPGFTALSPNINVNTPSDQLRTELLNTFNRLDGQLQLAPYRFATQNGPVSNTGAAETPLMVTSVDFGTLNKSGSSILIFAAGNTAANGNNKTLNLVLGSTTLFTSGALALNDIDWTLQAEIVYNGGSSQISWAQFMYNGSAPIVTTTTATEAFAGNLSLYISGTGTATGDISCLYYKAILLK